MKRIFTFVICLFLMLALMPTTVAEAKAKPKLSTQKKTMYVGATYKIKLKNANSKVTWKTSKKSVVSIGKKKGKTITLKAKKQGKATITATFKGKKYKCKVTVKKKAVPDNPTLNATDVTLYHVGDEYAPYINLDPTHLQEFRFKVMGTKKEVRKWEIIGEDKMFFSITDYGLLKVEYGPAYGEFVKEATVQATLTDGRILTAKVRCYNEVNEHILTVFEEFKNTYITTTMTEAEKADKVAWYVSAISDYEAIEPNWCHIFLKGSGDCMASRYAVQYLCQYIGVKAQACRSIDAHGMTVVKADGKFYLIVTGYAGTKPRMYSMYEIDEATVRKYCEDYNMSEAYFGLE